MTFQLTCMGGEFARAINLASNVSGHGKQYPILKAVRIIVAKGTCTISATNLDHAISASFAAAGDGSAYIDVELLTAKVAVLRANNPVDIQADAEGKIVTIKQGRSSWKVPVLLGDGFPDAFIAPIKGKAVETPLTDFLAAMDTATRAVNSADTTRSIGRGVLVDPSDTPSVIATDGKKMMVVSGGVPKLARAIIMPLAAITGLRNIFRDTDNAKVACDDKALTVTTDDVFYKTKLVEDQYPDWRKLAEKNSTGLDKSVTVDRQAFLDSLNRAMAINEDKLQSGTAVGVRLEIGGGECVFVCKNKTQEEGSDACEAIGDVVGEVGTNALNLRAMVDSFSSDRVTIEFGDLEAPIIIRPVDASAEVNYRLVMPYRV